MTTVSPRPVAGHEPWSLLAEFSAAGVAGVECTISDQTAQAVAALGLPAECLKRLSAALHDAALSALQPGRHQPASRSIVIRVLASASAASAASAASTVGAEGRGAEGRAGRPLGRPSPGGWGFFLVKRLTAPCDGQPGCAELQPTIDIFLYQERSGA